MDARPDGIVFGNDLVKVKNGDKAILSIVLQQRMSNAQLVQGLKKKSAEKIHCAGSLSLLLSVLTEIKILNIL